MPRFPFAPILLALALPFLAGCAGGGNPHFFPRTHPLFAGFDEARLGGGAKAMLAEAKEDFALARHGGQPAHAKFASTIPGTHSRVYDGRGYRLTIVDRDDVVSHEIGPKIVLNAPITGGAPFSYDEVNVLGD